MPTKQSSGKVDLGQPWPSLLVVKRNIMEKKSQCAWYVRCSTSDQVEKFGLDLQREKLQALATLNDYKVDEKYIYSDEGFSGTLPADKRPALNRLR